MEHPPAVETVFVAVATSIASIRPMLRRALAAPAHPRLNLLYAADSREHILYRGEIAQWSRGDHQFSFGELIAAPADLDARLFAEVERRWVKADGNRSRAFYLCGVGNPVLQLRDLLRGAGYERRAVRYEVW